MDLASLIGFVGAVGMIVGAMITGGGGFSARYARPSYQAAAVEGYLAALGRRGLLPRPAMFTASGWNCKKRWNDGA